MKILQSLKRKVRQNSLAWQYLLNFKPSVSHMCSKPKLSGEARRVLEDLQRDGIAVTTKDALLGGGSAYQRLEAEVERLQKEDGSKIEAARAHASDPNSIGQKTFIYFLLGDKPPMDSESAFAQFALQEQVLGISDS